LSSKVTSVTAKTLATLFVAILAISAMFNLRVGFGAQNIDCIDSFMHIVHYKAPGTIESGEYVVFVGPEKMKEPFAGHLIIKKVAAVAGDTVKVKDGILFINGEKAGELDVADKAAKRLGVSEDSFNMEQVIPEGLIFVRGTKPRSFDSRYWGLLPIQNVVGSAYPVI